MLTKTIKTKRKVGESSPEPTTGTSDSNNSKEKLISAAEYLFVRKGFGGVSIREIASRAKVNSALINYHFGGKDGLFKVVYESVAAPMNRSRMQNFERLKSEIEFSVEDVLRAWVLPMFERPKASHRAPVADLSLSLGWEHSELTNQMMSDVYDAVNDAFLSLMETCLPNVPRDELVWRLFFLIGSALTATRAHERSMLAMSRGKFDGRDTVEMAEQLIRFAAGGFRE
ncbi:TetR family transcriptional regulator [Pandoraea pnomenusa]|uniref:TetR/AcrR family transcriptional regulator n=1 Tax=Pandoraea pnomenusa TaxID=93220 RepID=UPI003340CB83